VKLVIPFAPGGPTDMIARMWTERLQQSLGQPFVIDNRGGAGGQIGTEVVVRAPADGYTLLLASNSVLSYSLALRKTPVEAPRDLTAIARVGDVIAALAVHPSIPVKNIDEFKDYVRKHPGQVSYGTPGIGSAYHLVLESIRLHTGLDMLHVPYRGAAEAYADLLAGVVPVGYDTGFLFTPPGRLTYVAVLADERMAARPDLPTMIEAGMVPISAKIWYGFYGPVGLPREITDKLNAEIARIGSQPEIQEALLKRTAVVKLMKPDELATALADEIRTNREIVRKAGITIE
jgi:tripartite-type tricarboxylate transporter receptor subunit TctC